MLKAVFPKKKYPVIKLNLMTKEAFWNPLFEATGGGLQRFYDWIDVYKKEVGWDTLFQPDVKFHDLPDDMQLGVLDTFLNLECGLCMDYERSEWPEAVKAIHETIMEMEELVRYCPGDCIYDSILKPGEEKCARCIKADAFNEQIWALENQIEDLREAGKGEPETEAQIDALWTRIKELETEAEKV